MTKHVPLVCCLDKNAVPDYLIREEKEPAPNLATDILRKFLDGTPSNERQANSQR